MFTKNQFEILSIFFTHPEKDYNLTEIGEIIKKKPGVFKKTMDSLEKWGILISRKRGNQRLYKIYENFRFISEMKSMVEKTFGAEGLIRDLVNSIKGIKTAFIYGSYAKDALRPDSDIDLLIVGNPNIEDELLGKITILEKKIDREINYTFHSLKDYKENIKKKNPFLEEVLNDKYILLKGNP